MKQVKLNPNWNAAPINPAPVISSNDDAIELSFLLNSSDFEYIDESEKGILTFYNVHMYRLGTADKDGYLNGQFRFKNDKLPWGHFYELTGTKWESDFPDDKIVLDETLDKKELRHFIFFMEGQTFECIATDYRFQIDNGLSETLDEKYPKGYLNYYLSMFASQFDKPSVENFKIYTNLYLQFQSKKEFDLLKAELKNIKKNKDLKLYLKYANGLEIADFGTKQLNEMVKVIETHK